MGYKWNPFTGNFDRVEDTGPADPDIETITGDSGGAVGPDSVQNINILGNPDIDLVGTPGTFTLQATNLTKMSAYIVDSTAGAAPYQTIQAALDAANTAGGGMVFVRPGTYTENLTLYDLTQVIGAVGLGDFGAVVIDGVHTPPNTGSFVFRNVRLDSATDVFASAAAGSAILTIIDANIIITNGFLFDLPNWTGTFVTYDLADNSTNNGMVNNTGGATSFFVSATHGAGTGNTMVTSGPVIMQEIDFNCPWDAQTGTTVSCDYVIFTQNVTCSNNSTGSFSNCRFTTGASQALTMSSSASIDLVNAIIDSSNNPSIGGAGAGTLELDTITFLNNSAIAATVTTGYQVMEAGTAYLQNISFDRGTSTMSSDGQLWIGSGAGNPAPSTLTAGTGMTVTNAANSITLAAAAATPLSFPTDSGTATPAANALSILGQSGFLSTTGAGAVVTTNLTTNFECTSVHGWNGSIIETASVAASSDGATITFSVEKSGGGNLTVIFSDGFYDWTTAPDTIALTAGSDTSPTLNYVYFLQSTKALTVSTVGWPATEHAPLATVLCESAATFQTKQAYKFHAWTDHVTATDDQGHIGDLNFWIRQQDATYKSGVAQTYTITPNGGAADNVILTTTAGVVLQLHDHTFPAFAGTPDLYVVNDSVTPYTIVTDLNALLTDSTGASMSNKYFSLVIWGVVSEATGDCKLMVNLPGGSYNTQTGVENDSDRFANFDIPADFKGTGFLISEWKLRHQAAASGTWTSIDEVDLRGLTPSIVPGGGSSFPVEFPDNTFRIFDDGDDTKKIAFQASGIATGNTRTITMINADLDLNTVSNSFPTDSGTAAPTANALTIAGGANISTSGAATTVTIAASGFAAFTWSEVTGDTAMAVLNGYIANKAGTATAFTLPATAAVGELLRICGKGATGWTLAQNAGQTIHFGSVDTTTGAGGSLASSDPSDSIELICTTANTDFTILSSIGNITIV
jgi:hypothetical protein